MVALTLPLSYLVKTSLVPLTGRVAAPDVSAAFKYGKFSSTSKLKEMKMEIAAWILSGSIKCPNFKNLKIYFIIFTSNSEGETQQENGGLSVGQHIVFLC